MIKLFLFTLATFFYFKYEPNPAWIKESKMLILYYNCEATRKYIILFKTIW